MEIEQNQAILAVCFHLLIYLSSMLSSSYYRSFQNRKDINRSKETDPCPGPPMLQPMLKLLLDTAAHEGRPFHLGIFVKLVFKIYTLCQNLASNNCQPLTLNLSRGLKEHP